MIQRAVRNYSRAMYPGKGNSEHYCRPYQGRIRAIAAASVDPHPEGAMHSSGIFAAVVPSDSGNRSVRQRLTR